MNLTFLKVTYFTAILIGMEKYQCLSSKMQHVCSSYIYLHVKCDLLLNFTQYCKLFVPNFQWENHAKSLKLEEQTLEKIKSRIQEKVMNNIGTWIDWQYLLDAATLLKKVRQSQT